MLWPAKTDWVCRGNSSVASSFNRPLSHTSLPLSFLQQENRIWWHSDKLQAPLGIPLSGIDQSCYLMSEVPPPDPNYNLIAKGYNWCSWETGCEWKYQQPSHFSGSHRKSCRTCKKMCLLWSAGDGWKHSPSQWTSRCKGSTNKAWLAKVGNGNERRAELIETTQHL